MKNQIRSGYFFNPDTRQLLIIKHDEDAANPREWDNLTTMLCKHSHYRFGDAKESAQYSIEEIKALAREFALRQSGARVLYVNDNDSSDVITASAYWKLRREGYYDEIYHYVAGREDYSKLSDTNKVLFCALLYIYDHSGVTMWMAGHKKGYYQHEYWDSCCVGLIVVFRNDVISEHPDCDKKPLEFWENICAQDVKTYDTYLTGDVYWYRLVEINDDLEEGDDDSCGGFFNDGDDTLPHLLSYAGIALQQFKDNFTELDVNGRYGCGCSGEEMERALSAIEKIYMERLEEEFG